MGVSYLVACSPVAPWGRLPLGLYGLQGGSVYLLSTVFTVPCAVPGTGLGPCRRTRLRPPGARPSSLHTQCECGCVRVCVRMCVGVNGCTCGHMSVYVYVCGWVCGYMCVSMCRYE